MPKYITEFSHTLGQSEALARLKMRARQAAAVSNLNGTWSENTFEFSVTAQGVGLRGTLRVEPDALKLDCHLPLFAMPFAGWLRAALEKSLKQAEPAGKYAGDEANRDKPNDGLTPALVADAEPLSPAVLFLHI